MPGSRYRTEYPARGADLLRRPGARRLHSRARQTAPVSETGEQVEGAVPVRPVRWAGWDGAREDRRSAVLTVVLLALAGLPVGALWVALAPRASFRVTATGIQPVGAAPSPELFIADDGVYLMLLAGLGVLAGLVLWLARRHRGVVALVGVAAGMIAAALIAWQFGQLLAPGPTPAQLAQTGATVTTGLRLGAVAAVAVGPFFAVLVYLSAATLSSRDDLGRVDADRRTVSADAPQQQPAH